MNIYMYCIANGTIPAQFFLVSYWLEKLTMNPIGRISTTFIRGR